MQMSVSVRPAQADDEAALLALDARSWSPESGFLSLLGDPQATFFTDRAGPADHLVAELDERVVGYVRLTAAYPMPEGAHVLAIHGLAVDPEARGHGAGGALLEAAEEYAHRRGARKITLNVFATNAAARRLYARHGYVQEGLRRREFRIDDHWVDDLTLARHLDSAERPTQDGP